jgi:hypothetical protein
LRRLLFTGFVVAQETPLWRLGTSQQRRSLLDGRLRSNCQKVGVGAGKKSRRLGHVGRDTKRSRSRRRISERSLRGISTFPGNRTRVPAFRVRLISAINERRCELFEQIGHFEDIDLQLPSQGLLRPSAQSAKGVFEGKTLLQCTLTSGTSCGSTGCTTTQGSCCLTTGTQCNSISSPCPG